MGKRKLERAKLKEREGAPKPRERGRGDRGVRGSIAMGAVGRKRPRSGIQRPFKRRIWHGRGKAARVQLQSAEAFSGVVKTPGPLVSRMEPKTPESRERFLRKVAVSTR